MYEEFTILYIHGMGGGGDSRIPSILRECFSSHHDSCHVNVFCRTYSFDPEEAHVQIGEWVGELCPDLIVGESLGALHALRITGVPCLLVSPALNAPVYFEILSWLTFIPGVTWLFDRIYKPREGDRQKLHFTFSVLRKYSGHRRAAIESAGQSFAHGNYIHSFFGAHDHYRRSGIVSVRSWKKRFGTTFSIYDGTHFMEEEYVRTLLVSHIYSVLNIK